MQMQSMACYVLSAPDIRQAVWPGVTQQHAYMFYRNLAQRSHNSRHTGSVQISIIFQYYLMHPQQALCWQLTKTHTKLSLRGQQTHHSRASKTQRAISNNRCVTVRKHCRMSAVSSGLVPGLWAICCNFGAAAVGQHIHH